MRSIGPVLALCLAGCVGQITFEEGPGDDAPDAGADTPDAPPATDLALSGVVRDHFEGSPLAAAQLTTEGLDPALTFTTGADGAYSLGPVLPGASFHVRATMAANYRTTVIAAVIPEMATPGTPVALDLGIVSNVYAQRQASTAGLPSEPQTSIIIADLLTGEGTPKEGIPLADITLVDALAAPVGAGPYFVGANGDIDPLLTVSTAYNGHARVVFLNVPPGPVTLKTAFGGGTIIDVPVTSEADLAHVARIQGGGGGGGGMMPDAGP